MRLPRLLLRSVVFCAASLVFSASLASAAHVPQVLPLTNSPYHAHEKFASQAFPAADYSSYDFSFADLSNCTFAPGSNLTNADFTGANLTNANLAGCILDLARFAGANLTNAALPCMGGADFRGAILTGLIAGGSSCGGCGLYGPNVYDVCTASPFVSLCMTSIAFRGVVSGVVFTDMNSNGLLDLGEPGVPGAAVFVNGVGAIPSNTLTDGRGSYVAFSANPAPGTVQVVLPSGYALSGPGSLPFNLGVCRNGQGLNFPVLVPATPAVKSTFARVKALYR